MKTAGRENPNRRDRLSNEPSPWGGRPKPFLLNQGGWRSRKHPAAGEVFFLTSPFIELLGTWTKQRCTEVRTWRGPGCKDGLSSQQAWEVRMPLDFRPRRAL